MLNRVRNLATTNHRNTFGKTQGITGARHIFKGFASSVLPRLHGSLTRGAAFVNIFIDIVVRSWMQSLWCSLALLGNSFRYITAYPRKVPGIQIKHEPNFFGPHIFLMLVWHRRTSIIVVEAQMIFFSNQPSAFENGRVIYLNLIHSFIILGASTCHMHVR